MVEDRPWSSRMPEMGAWYNSGVVLIEGIPLVLRDWERECINNPTQGRPRSFISTHGRKRNQKTWCD